MQNLFTRFIEDESGATAIEYGLIAALIAVGMIVGAQAVGKKVNAKFEDIGTRLDDASANGGAGGAGGGEGGGEGGAAGGA